MTLGILSGTMVSDPQAEAHRGTTNCSGSEGRKGEGSVQHKPLSTRDITGRGLLFFLLHNFIGRRKIYPECQVQHCPRQGNKMMKFQRYGGFAVNIACILKMITHVFTTCASHLHIWLCSSSIVYDCFIIILLLFSSKPIHGLKLPKVGNIQTRG